MKKIYLSPPHMSGKELEYIKDVFEDNWIAPIGPHLNMFEDIVKKYTVKFDLVFLFVILSIFSLLTSFPFIIEFSIRKLPPQLIF